MTGDTNKRFGGRMAAWALAAVLFMAILPADGRALAFQGRFVQGGLVVGRTVPGASVTFQGTPIRVSPDGLFVIGFDRDAPPSATLVLQPPGGAVETREVAVEKREYDIQRIDGLPPRKVNPNPDDLKRIQQEAALVKNARAQDAARTDFARPFIWPVTGRISGVFGSQRILNGEPRRPHYGIDIAAPAGTPVVAPADGVVRLVHPDMFFSGGTLIIDHGHGVSTSYLHLQTILVKEGDAVEQGDVVAKVGATGRVTGPHLDWRVNWFQNRLDPALLVPPMPAPGESS